MSNDKHVLFDGGAKESTPLMSKQTSSNSSEDNFYSNPYGGEELFVSLKPEGESRKKDKSDLFAAADRLSVRLLQIDDDDSEEEDRILRESLNLLGDDFDDLDDEGGEFVLPKKGVSETDPWERLCTMTALGILAICLIGGSIYIGVKFVGPPSQPVGPYQLVERQEGMELFDFYNFYEGRDSVGSNGYNMYIGKDKAVALGLINSTAATDASEVYYDIQERRERRRNKRQLQASATESFVFMGSAATKEGPRDSIRLEGKRRFNRGLFIIDLRHMPAGCGIWPAFWLTDEANWPVNGEIDIVEGVNYQSMAKTALHSTQGCVMDDIPQGVSTGGWDEAVGIPDKKTGIPDMTEREARNCFVYDPHQWLNQGCVATDKEGDSLGVPLNEKGGGVFVLEWDPAYRHMRSWVFAPHTKVPKNLRDTINTAHLPIEKQTIPDPSLWPLPYGYFAIGEGTNCPAYHFKNMHLVFNLAFCGSVAGNRYFMDCPAQKKQYDTCNEYVASEPDELKEAYWKIRGVYVYERQWERAWM